MKADNGSKIDHPQIPESFKGLLSNGKVVQNSILERTEKKVSLLEGRQSVTLYSKTVTPPSLNQWARHLLSKFYCTRRKLLHC